MPGGGHEVKAWQKEGDHMDGGLYTRVAGMFLNLLDLNDYYTEPDHVTTHP